ncbi:MAG: hypothetical protein GC146_11520 [Limimaricola sp.]|uniref:hypothetical protein n=1 Tax=Limimaricola sp. TaxID=2211665 RepID=UPI001D8D1DF3|nr:hypothetical protein [Limimaricola sp.]MBI1417843.1 hypothetical protein [Limimaricola sp.]
MQFNRFLHAAALIGATAISGCAEQASNVPATYIPSIIYRGATCQELAQERQNLAHYVVYVTAQQRNSAQWDTALVTTSLVIFWPAVFALPLTVDQSAQLASARGHYDALVKAQAEQGCGGAAPSTYSMQQTPYYAGTVGGTGNWRRYPGQFPPM